MTEKNDYRIRAEGPDDYRKVENLVREAFWNVYRPGCYEHYVLHRYRGREDFVPQLDLVLEKDGDIIGHIMYVRGKIQAGDGSEIPVMTFGPLSIHRLAAERLWESAGGLFAGKGRRNGSEGRLHRGRYRVLWKARFCNSC